MNDKVILTMADLTVLLDTLTASLSIADGVGLFHYTKNTREDLWKTLHQRLENVEIKVKQELRNLDD